MRAGDVKELQALGDAMREKLGSGVGVLAASFEDGKNALLVVVTDDLRERGVRADALIKDIAAAAGGQGRRQAAHGAGGHSRRRALRRGAVSRAGSGARRARRRVVTLGAWLRDRSPAPPARLAGARRGEFGEHVDDDAAAAPRALHRRRGATARAICFARPTTGRESALDLLTVDALVTYALEAAAPSPESLRRARPRTP